jgi:hypothetical protein
MTMAGILVNNKLVNKVEGNGHGYLTEGTEEY